jgi:hypothetical protein
MRGAVMRRALALSREPEFNRLLALSGDLK